MNRNLEPTERATAINEAFVRARDAVAAQVLQDGDGVAACERLTTATDTWLRELWCEAGDFPATLTAVGGYGRAELCLGSDIDLAIEVDAEALAADALVDGVTRFVTWARATRVKLAHSVRTVGQAHAAFREDVRTAVATLDARPLGEAPQVARAEAVEFLRADDDGRGFVAQLFDGYIERLERDGQSIYLLEPNVKLGKGALRDLHTLRWAAAATGEQLTAPEVAEVEEGFRWLINVRFVLHALHGRKHERLYFPDQEAVAEILLGQGDRDGAEALMQQHYRRTRAIAKVVERRLRRWKSHREQPQHVDTRFTIADGQLVLASEAPATLRDVLDGLEIASATDTLLEPRTEMRFEAASRAAGDLAAADFVKFRALLTGLDQSPRTSTRLLELGVIPRMIEEFEPVVCHVQHDVYHVYTTDVHLVRCLEFGRALLRGADAMVARWPKFAAVAQRIEDRETFLLAALLHDVGKNRGGGHSERGAVMALEFGPRLGLTSEQTDLLSFLIREHLSLSHAARRHDLSDRRLVRDLASRIRTEEALNQLTTLTFCDISTVGNAPITDWTASLLMQLHERLQAALRHGIDAAWRQLDREVEAVRQRLRDGAGLPATGATYADAFVRDVPASYLVEASAAALGRAFDAWRRGDEGEIAIVTTPDEERGSTEVIVCAADTPGVLAKITGTISALGFNILDARIATTSRGRVLDIFQVARYGGASHALHHAEQRAVTDEARLQRLREQLTLVLRGEVDVAELLAQRENEQRLKPRETPDVEASVEVLEISDDYTVVQVKASDRIGLLHDITQTLADCGVDIRLSKIDSEGTQIVDTFYLESLSHQPLDADVVDAVCAAVARVVTG